MSVDLNLEFCYSLILFFIFHNIPFSVMIIFHFTAAVQFCFYRTYYIYCVLSYLLSNIEQQNVGECHSALNCRFHPLGTCKNSVYTGICREVWVCLRAEHSRERMSVKMIKWIWLFLWLKKRLFLYLRIEVQKIFQIN